MVNTKEVERLFDMLRDDNEYQEERKKIWAEADKKIDELYSRYREKYARIIVDERERS